MPEWKPKVQAYPCSQYNNLKKAFERYIVIHNGCGVMQATIIVAFSWNIDVRVTNYFLHLRLLLIY